MSSEMGGMAPVGSSVRVDRVVAVVATLQDGREQLGSGYLTSGRLVLTAEHCTRDKVTGEPAARLKVIRASDSAEAQVAGVVPDRGLDVAVLQLADDALWDPGVPPSAFARVDQSHSGVLDDCTGIGFPWFQRDPDRRTRHTAEFHGRIYQTDERESGRLLMREPLIHLGPVTGAEGETLTDRGGHGPSPWGGLSGALMFYRGNAIGVVVEHHPRQGDSALRAVGFERIAAVSAEIRQCLGLPPPDSLPWVSEDVAVQLAPASGVPVSEADPRRLGMHQAISVPGVPDEIPPEYVPRDVDAAEFGVRARVAAAAERGGFVLLVGGSSVGKTRSAFEAIRALLSDWWLVHPAGSAEVARLAAAPRPRTVVWLDELQRYLDGEHGLTGGVVRALLNAPHPAVITGTLWPDRYAAYAAVPAPGSADPYAREREVLKLADVVRIAPEFSPAEQDRARAAAARDPRLRVALDTAGYGLTQTLAAAPQLVARWEDAKTASPYAWAVLTAALDATRLGARTPLSIEFLRAAASGYCTSQQQAEAPENWFAQALAYATAKLHGAVAALSSAGVSMGQVAGYTAADYLIQHASRERRYERTPASTWDAVLSHVRDPADTTRLADSARNRLLYRYAIPLYCLAADAGDRDSARRLAELLEERGDLDGLRARADVGDGAAAVRLTGLLVERGDLNAAEQVLRACAEAGDSFAAERLAELLEERGDLNAAEQVLRARADLGDRDAASRLADLLARRGDLEQAAQVLRAQADAGDRDAAVRLARLLARRGDLDAAEQVLRARADAGDMLAAERLAELLEERGDLDGLRARANAGDPFAAGRLADLLVRRGDLNGLRARADAGDRAAAVRLAELLVERGDLNAAEQVLRARAEDSFAAERLAELLEERGDLEQAAQVLRARADAGDPFAAGRLADLLVRRGDLDGLRARADAGDGAAAVRLAELLEERGDLEQAVQVLRAQVDAGDRDAAWRLAELLEEHADLDGLRARADAGDEDAAPRLARLLAGRGDLEQAVQVLRAPADAGDRDAALRLADLLARRGDLDGLRARADAGDRPAAVRLTELLEERGDLEGLRARVDAGDRPAASRLAGLLIKQGRGEEAERLRRFGLNLDGSIACA